MNRTATRAVVAASIVAIATVAIYLVVRKAPQNLRAELEGLAGFSLFMFWPFALFWRGASNAPIANGGIAAASLAMVCIDIPIAWTGLTSHDPAGSAALLFVPVANGLLFLVAYPAVCRLRAMRLP